MTIISQVFEKTGAPVSKDRVVDDSKNKYNMERFI